ncbi:cyclopropane-fatty-acyl-phospholipid synthase family protein [Tsuneonella sp. YG55]|uniref:Cyclopropane-fatty-acyl-phospholipid synthase family protein n=1 Tax=Tsuneonella litorea TaxID=2976475 RepID=A0A9X2W071_9SPHN|nr:cyclopropane-fatty-acyl-phospholipid synthase family protein [Tsuneonella litorea]MCT2558193.1 cyclopropane-fatty-acyl-phospholipid synthase family protein [Tsuneonella litorea]
MRAEGLGRGGSLLSAGDRFARRPGWLARLFAPGFHKILDRIDAGLETGSILGLLPDGTRRLLGGRNSGFEAEVRIRDWRALLRLATNGSIGWYQAWEAGEWDSPDPIPVFALFMANGDALGDTGRARGPFRWAARFVHWLNRNTHTGAERNIHAHYDLGNDFYAAWLGRSMCYSSAIFEDADGPGRSQQRLDPLDYAQLAKATAMLNRVNAHEATSILEIGCGWGMLAHAAAQNGRARVDAISLSDEQLAFCRAKASDPANPRFLKQDYRDTHGQYDAIVSVEMVEALGREYWPTFMDCVARNLKPGGRAAIQFISMKESLFEAYARSADFIQAYVFPGGLLIKSSEFRALAEGRGLAWTDETRFGDHYARTLRLWRENFDRAVEEGGLPAGFDDRFVRLWRYYLMYCEGGFLGGGIDVHQVTLVKPAG